jgi:hypothetical protein
MPDQPTTGQRGGTEHPHHADHDDHPDDGQSLDDQRAGLAVDEAVEDRSELQSHEEEGHAGQQEDDQVPDLPLLKAGCGGQRS